MRTSFLAIQLLVSSSFSWAFTTTSTFVPRNRIATGGVSAVVSQRKTVLYSQWDEEDEATSTTSTPGQRTSFDDAGDVLRKEDDDSLLNAMDDFDNNPLVRTVVLSTRVKKIYYYRGCPLLLKLLRVPGPSIGFVLCPCYSLFLFFFLNLKKNF